MTPYFERAGIVIYHGDCREVLPSLAAGSVDLVLTDPPYGVSERTDRLTRKRTALAPCHDFPAIVGDDEPFDPSPLLRFRRLVLFGANHYAERLPASSSWIVWDKRDGLTSRRGDAFNDNGDAELVWTNLGGPVRTYSHRWLGMLKDSERTDRRVHPTQKPVALMVRIIDWHTDVGAMILDPYMGSGPVLAAAYHLGRRAIGIEIDERYCEIAARRLSQMVLPLVLATGD
jgi:site-specific DNA-methyltransferase (adenine-specific)/modification methylase